MFYKNKINANFKHQPRLKAIMTLALLCFVIIWITFYFYHNANQSIEIIQSWIFFTGMLVAFLASLTLIVLELYSLKKISQKKLVNQLKLKEEQYNKLEKEFEFVLNHDISTQLPNKKAIANYLDRIIESNQNCTIFAVSLNNIYFISDTYGDEIIEALLIELVARFTYILGENNLLARVEIDKIMIVYPGISSLNAEMLANQLYSSLTEQFILDENEIILYCSIGIAYYQSGEAQTNRLIHQANMALRRAKTQTNKQIATYHSKIQREFDEKKNFERTLKYAINNDELILNFQPQIDLRTNKIVGVEALIRWLDRKGNNIMPPHQIIKTAEKSGLMLSLGHWVMEKAMKQYSILLDERCAPNIITINASGLEFKDNAFTEHINRTLTYYDIPPSRVQIELSEQTFANDIENIVLALHRLSELGVSLAINDFGTGYLSLYYLKQLPISTLKIDPSFIKNLPNSKDDMVICQTIITMANLLQIKVISVGIEDEQQQSMLQNIGCHYAQGRYLYKPIPFTDLLTLLKQQRESRNVLSSHYNNACS